MIYSSLKRVLSYFQNNCSLSLSWVLNEMESITKLRVEPFPDVEITLRMIKHEKPLYERYVWFSDFIKRLSVDSIFDAESDSSMFESFSGSSMIYSVVLSGSDWRFKRRVFAMLSFTNSILSYFAELAFSLSILSGKSSYGFYKIWLVLFLRVRGSCSIWSMKSWCP